jgi:hypothetical protein
MPKVSSRQPDVPKNIDTDALKASVSIVEFISRDVKLRKDGAEYVGLCPFHNERTPSFRVYPDHYHCYGCGAHGDVIDYVTETQRVDFREACRLLGAGELGPSQPDERRAVAKAIDIYAGYEPLELPADALDIFAPGKMTPSVYNPKRAGDLQREWGQFVPALVHPYRYPDGKLFGFVLRHDFENGEKETPQIRFVRRPDGEECWSRMPFPKPHPLYGLEILAQHRDRQVIVVEGEKSADAARRAFAGDNPVVVTWPGGTQQVHLADWTPLAGRRVILWPDADKPGYEAMLGHQDKGGKWKPGLAEMLIGLRSTVEFIDVMAFGGAPKGFDAADTDSDAWSGMWSGKFAWCRHRESQELAWVEQKKPPQSLAEQILAWAKPRKLPLATVEDCHALAGKWKFGSTGADIKIGEPNPYVTVEAADNFMLDLVNDVVADAEVPVDQAKIQDVIDGIKNDDDGSIDLIIDFVRAYDVTDQLVDDAFDAQDISRPSSAPEPLERIASADDQPSIGEFQRGKNSEILKSQANIRLALARLGVKLSYDEFARRELYQVGDDPGRYYLDDAVVRRLWLTIDERYGFTPAKEFFWDVVIDLARRNSFHPVRDYLAGLVWDGVPRIDRWLTTYGGARADAYTSAVGGLILVAAVRRIRQPGCKFDEMLLLISEKQGKFKSTALRELTGDDYFTDSFPLDADDKIVIEQTSGKWIVEAGELKGMREADSLKALLSKQVDRARLAYGKQPVEQPRHFIVIGTSNKSKPLSDPTGNRRFWPVGIGQFDVEAIRRDRDQLWAEAAHREAQGVSIRLPESLWAEAGRHQEAHRGRDAWHDVMVDVLGDKDDPECLCGKVKSEDAWRIVGVPKERRDQKANDRFGTVMKDLGFQKGQRRFGGPRAEYCYLRGEEETRDLPVIRVDDNGKSAWIDEDRPL